MQEQCFVRLKLGQREEQRLSQVDEVCRMQSKIYAGCVAAKAPATARTTNRRESMT